MSFIRAEQSVDQRFHLKQWQAYLAYRMHKDLVLPWGRRSGKSDLISEVFIEDIEEHGKDCMYMALSQKQAREIMWPKFDLRLRDETDWKSNESRLEWKHVPSGAVISLKGTDEGYMRLRGSAKRMIAADEYAFYRKPDELMKEVVRPMLADFNGQMIYASSPKGKNHFYHLIQRSKREPHKLFASKCTMFDNPYISPQGRDNLLAEYSGPDDLAYRQEVLGEFVDFEGKVFAVPFDTFIEKRWDYADLTHSFHWRGVDHGYNPDPTACVWVAFNQKKGYFQVYQEYKEKALLIHQHAASLNGLEAFSYVSSYSDIDPQVIAEFENVGLSMTPADKRDKEASLLRMVSALKSGRLKVAHDCKMLLEEMQAYEWGQDGNDHLVDAFRYAWNSLQIPEARVVEEPYAPKRAALPDAYGSNDGYGQDFG